MIDKIGRNDDCPCGSGLKYKKCCGRQNKMLTEKGLLKTLLLVIVRADGLIVNARDVEMLSDELAIGVKYDPDTDQFELKAVKRPEPKLIQVASKIPKIDKRILN